MKLEILSDDHDFVSRCRSVMTVWSDIMCVDVVITAHSFRDMLPDRTQPGILFADADGLTGIQGMKLLESVRDTYAALFICSADSRKAIDCYGLRPAGFIPKPISAAVVDRNMNRCISQWQPSLQWLELMENRSRIRIPVCEILWIEATGRGCAVHTLRREIQAGESITKLNSILPEHLFVRSHRSFLANLRFVRDMDGRNLFLEDGSPVPVGRGSRNEVVAALERHRSIWNWDGGE